MSYNKNLLIENYFDLCGECFGMYDCLKLFFFETGFLCIALAVLELTV